MTNHRTGSAWWWVFRVAAVATILAAIMGLSACSPNFSVPQSGSPFVVPAENAQGGSLDDFEMHRRALNANKNPIEIRRDIYSAATFYLAGDVSCISPDVKVGYHGPINSGPAIATSILLTGIPVDDFMSDAEHDRVVRMMQYIYAEKSPRMAKWFVESGASDKFGVFFTTKTGQEVHDEFGIPLCEGV